MATRSHSHHILLFTFLLLGYGKDSARTDLVNVNIHYYYFSLNLRNMTTMPFPL
jgi:hypothetical protein